MHLRCLFLGVALVGCTASGPIEGEIDPVPSPKADDAAEFVATGAATQPLEDSIASYQRGTFLGYRAVRTVTGRGEAEILVQVDPVRDFDAALESCTALGEGFALQSEDGFLFPIILGHTFLRLEVRIDPGVADGVRHVYPAWLQGSRGNEQLVGTDLLAQMADGEGTRMEWGSLAATLEAVRSSFDELNNDPPEDMSEEDLIRTKAFMRRAISVFEEGIPPVCVRPEAAEDAGFVEP